jgi:uncharacterized membrane protein YedE/YeeE
VIARAQAAVLGGLVSVAAFCGCGCLTFPFYALVAIADGDVPGPPDVWGRPTMVLAMAVTVSIVFGVGIGARVGRDWYRTTRNSAGPLDSPES